MARVFLVLFLLLLIGVAWVSVPRGIKRECPVCQGAGFLPASHPTFEARNEKWVQREKLLCPFCEGGRISLYELGLKRQLMMKWMLREQKLPPKTVAERVEKAWGKAGLDELQRNNFFLETQ